MPPVVTVVDGASGNPICDPGFAVVSCTGAIPSGPLSIYPCDGTTNFGCDASADGGADRCRFSVGGLNDSAFGNTCTLTVSAPGFVSATVAGVVSGVGGCVDPVSASRITVTLAPTSDAAVSSK